MKYTNYYDILEVKPDDSLIKIKAQFFLKIRESHPDKVQKFN